MNQDELHELDALARLANLLEAATAGDAPPGANAMATALAIRLKTLTEAIRLLPTA